MDLNKLKQCKVILNEELCNNVKYIDKLQKTYQTRLSFLIEDIQSLISLQEKPELHEHLSKLCNPDKK